jgi:predicted metal-dependent phosphoesterase TrpH
MKIDFHVHSIASQDGTMTLCRIAGVAAEKGLDAVFVCDHNRVTLEKPVYMNGVWLMPGCELSCKNAHILAMFFEGNLGMENYDKNNLPKVEDAIERIHSAGGLAIIAHPFSHPVAIAKNWSPYSLTLHPDGCEAVNARAWMRDFFSNEKAREYAKVKGLFMIAGSDAHLEQEIGNAYTELDCAGIEGIRAALEEGRTKPVLYQNTKRIYKGWSQLERANRSGRSGRKLSALALLLKCKILDLTGK